MTDARQETIEDRLDLHRATTHDQLQDRDGPMQDPLLEYLFWTMPLGMLAIAAAVVWTRFL